MVAINNIKAQIFKDIGFKNKKEALKFLKVNQLKSNKNETVDEFLGRIIEAQEKNAIVADKSQKKQNKQNKQKVKNDEINELDELDECNNINLEEKATSMLKSLLDTKEIRNDFAKMTRVRYTFKQISCHYDIQLKLLYYVIKTIMKYNDDKGLFNSFAVLGYGQTINEVFSVRPFSVRPHFFTSYDLFKNFLDKMEEGSAQTQNNVGSAMAPNMDTHLLLNSFEIVASEPLVVNGKLNDLVLFDVVDEVEKQNKKIKDVNGEINKLCFMHCFNYLGCNLTEEMCTKLKLSNLKDFLRYAQDKNITVVSNSLHININDYQMIKKNHTELVTEAKGKYKTGLFYKINLENVHIKMLYLNRWNEIDTTNFQTNNEGKYLLYDFQQKHCSVMKSLNFKNNLYLECGGNIFEKLDEGYKQLTKLITIRHENIANKLISTNESMKVEYVFIDFEAVIDWNKRSNQKPYSIALACLDDYDLKRLDKADKNGDMDVINGIKITRCAFFLGYDCVKQFYDWYIKNQKNTIFKFITFNGSNYDNILLHTGLMEICPDLISDVQYHGNQLFNFKIAGRHDFFDLRKHIPKSLKEICTAFCINTCGKKQFSFYEAQKLHNRGKLIEYYTENAKELEEYNIYDVLSLAVAYSRYEKNFMEIACLKALGKRLYDIKTIGSASYKAILNHWVKNNIHINGYKVSKTDYPGKTDEEIEAIQKLMIKYFEDTKQHNTGGRTQNFNGKQKIGTHKRIKNTPMLVSPDACSLYPFVLFILNVWFPCGKMILADKYADMPIDKIGFFYCDIDQCKLSKKALATIYAEKTEEGNNWALRKKVYRKMISTFKIEKLRKYGAIVTPYEGYYFENKIKNYELFAPLIEIMQLKNGQDDKKDIEKDLFKQLKKCEDEETKQTIKKQIDANGYNSVFREICKLLMNAVTGKLIEGLHLDKTKIVTENECYELQAKYDNIDIKYQEGHKALITYKQTTAERIHESRPIYLGVLVYDYAQNHMYEHLYSKIPYHKLVYTDTDSLKIRYDDFVGWCKTYGKKTIVPHWPEIEQYDARYKTHPLYCEVSKVFGSFENEYKNTNYLNYHITKKTYLAIADEEKHEDKYKMSLKGISGRDIFIKIRDGRYYYTKNNEEIEIYTSYDDIFAQYCDENATFIENATDKEINESMEEFQEKIQQQQLHEIYNEADKIKDNPIELFEQLYTENKATILTLTFIRDIKNDNSGNVRIAHRFKNLNIDKNIKKEKEYETNLRFIKNFT